MNPQKEGSAVDRVKVGSLWRYRSGRHPHVRYRVIELGVWRSSYVPEPNVLVERDDLLPRKRRSREPESWLLNKLEEVYV